MARRAEEWLGVLTWAALWSFQAVIPAGDGIPTVANKDEDEDSLSGSFTWKIENFSKAVGPKLFSDTFTIGGYNW